MHAASRPARCCRQQGRPLTSPSIISHCSRVPRATAGARRAQRSSRCAPAAAAAAAAAPDTADDRGVRWASFVSRRINLDLALEEAVAGALQGGTAGAATTAPNATSGSSSTQHDTASSPASTSSSSSSSSSTAWEPELAVVFVSSAYANEYGSLVAALRARLPSLKHIVGCSGYGVIGSSQEGPEEIEHAPALALALGTLPAGTTVTLTHVTGRALPDGDAPPDAWAALFDLQLRSQQPTSFVLLAEPEFSKLQELTDGLDFAFPGAQKVGGLISAGKLSSARAMFAWSSDRQQQRAEEEEQPAGQQPADQSSEQQEQQGQFPPLLRTGALVLSLQGPVEMELLVAQGCRPLSDATYTIDAVGDGGPVVLALRDESGRKLMPLEALQRELEAVASSRSELMLLLSNMALGLVPEVLRPTSSGGSSGSSQQQAAAPDTHEYLIRGMALSKAGFMIVGDAVRAGQRVRFMVRDREGAQQDLTSHCLAYKRRELAATLGGGLFGSAAAAPPDAAETPPEQQQEQPQQPSGGDEADGASKGQQQQQPAQQQQRRAFGMLLFSCNGRGLNLYDEPSWDSRTLSAYIPVPCAGFMCNGEIGSLGGATHLHGFTCAAAVLRSTSGVLGAQGGAGIGTSSSSLQGGTAVEADGGESG